MNSIKYEFMKIMQQTELLYYHNSKTNFQRYAWYIENTVIHIAMLIVMLSGKLFHIITVLLKQIMFLFFWTDD